MSVFVCEKQTEDTVQLLKSRNFLLSFENKKLKDKLSSLEKYSRELEMKLTKNDQDRNEHGDGSGQNPVSSSSGETQLQWGF
jgi:prefoldin subunit 5